MEQCPGHSQLQDTINDLMKSDGKNSANIAVLLGGQQEIFAAIKVLTAMANENRSSIVAIGKCSDSILRTLKEQCEKWTARSNEVDEMFVQSEQEITSRIKEVADKIDAIDEENKTGMLGVMRDIFSKQIGKWLAWGILAALLLNVAKNLSLMDIIKFFAAK